MINYSPSEQEVNTNSLTILICAKNEYSNLKTLIPNLLNQTGGHKVLVVDDFSEDDSLSLLSAFANSEANFNFISASKNIPGKKQALMDGLSHVKTEFVLLTDADCEPANQQWATNMLNAKYNKELVLGFSPYKKFNGFLNRWIRYEAVLTAIQYFSYSLMGRTYMGVGRNLMYSKTLVNAGEALKTNIDLTSGDDDLLVNHLARPDNVAINLNQDAWVYSEPKKTLKAYFSQKRRHLSTASKYQKSHQILLILFSSSWILLYLSILILALFGNFGIALILLGLRLLSTYSTNIKLFPKLGLGDGLIHWWYLDPSTAVYFLIFSIFAILPQKETW